MRIMLASRVWETQRGGGMIHVVADRAHALAKAGHEVHVVTTSEATSAGAVREAANRVEGRVMVHYTATPAHNWSKEFAEDCLAWANKLGPDIVHQDSLDPENVWWWPGNKHRVAITMHGVRFGTFLTRWNELRTTGRISHGDRLWGKDPNGFMYEPILAEIVGLKAARVVIGCSKWEWRMMRDQYGLANARLVYNPVAQTFFDTPPSVTPRTGFLCAAISQGGTRGFTTAIQAAARAGVRLDVLTKAPRAEMVDALDRVRAVVLPTSFAQGFDVTICEARVRGTPAIMSPTGSYLDEAIEGWDRLVDIGDVDGLADAMRSFPAPQCSLSAYLATVGRSVHSWLQDEVDRHRPDIHAQNWLDAVQ